MTATYSDHVDALKAECDALQASVERHIGALGDILKALNTASGEKAQAQDADVQMALERTLVSNATLLCRTLTILRKDHGALAEFCAKNGAKLAAKDLRQ